MSDLLLRAYRGNYAIPAICVSNMESVLACFIAAEKAGSPVIIQSAYSEMNPQLITAGDLAGIVRTIGKRYQDIPYCIHLDHGMTQEECMMALEGGFLSIMYDGSGGSYEENVRVTKRLKDVAGPHRCVEAEVGRVGGEEGKGTNKENGIIKSDPEQLADFLAKTGADAIAVSIGNIHGCHGVIKQAPELDFALLQKLRESCGVPLVLHGASGIPEEDIRKAVTMGISKVNYYTQLYHCYMGCVRKNIDLTMEECMGRATEALAEEIMKLMDMCGSVDRI